jgi:hypothetical protein
MGEIKSTLDLVMEKTMHLSLSSEEKQELAAQEVENRIRGMLQKYQDGVLTPEELKNEYGSIKKDDKLTARRILIEEIIGRLDMLNVNGSLVEVLDELGGVETAGLRSVLDEFRGNYHNAAGKHSEEIKNVLGGEFGISGSAVVPNLSVDEQWRREELEIRSRFEESLDRVKAEFLDKVHGA